MKKFYRATSHLTPEGAKFLDAIKEFPYTISEPVIAKVPFTAPKLGITKILHIKKSEQTVTLELEILTGRTHQIRYHLSHHGLPIV
ncbi:MAG: pseudouridine synthase [bacterium]